jgi:hypothetical protein
LFHSCYRGSYNPTGDPAPRSRSGCMSGVQRGDGAAGRMIHYVRKAAARKRPSRVPAAPLPRCPAAYPSLYAPVRNGLVRRSMPTVVAGP